MPNIRSVPHLLVGAGGRGVSVVRVIAVICTNAVVVGLVLGEPLAAAPLTPEQTGVSGEIIQQLLL